MKTETFTVAMPNRGTHRKPICKRLARVFPTSRVGYSFMVRVGFFTKQRLHYFRTLPEAEVFAVQFNTPKRLLSAFRSYFRTDEETAAYLGIALPEAAPEPSKATAEALTPASFVKSATRVRSNPFTVKPYRLAQRPHLGFVVRGKEAGKYTAKFFKTEGEAKAYASTRNIDVLNEGQDTLNMPSWLRSRAIRCNAKLEEFGKTLIDATTFYVDALIAKQRSCPLDQLVNEFAESKVRQGFSTRYIRNVRRECGWFAAWAGIGTTVSEITTKQVNDYLATRIGLGGLTRNCKLATLRGLLKFAVSNGYCERNHALAAHEYKVVENAVGTLTPDELSRLLIAACNTPLLPYFAVGAFAGLRHAETCRLEWKEIDLESGHILVTAKKAKTAKRRLVKIQPNLARNGSRPLPTNRAT